jgi:hypothetical protein
VLQIISPFIVSQQGSALVRISDGGIVNVPEDTTTVGVNGRIEIDNGLMRTSQLQNSGTIIGNGELMVHASTTLNNQGRIEAGPGDRLLVSSPAGGVLQNNGALVVDGGELEFRRVVKSLSSSPNTGRITLNNGTVRFPFPTTTQPGLQNASLLAAIGGENHVLGRITNDRGGEIVATNDSILFFHHDVTSQGSITVAAGSKVIFLEDLINDGTLLADLSGAEGFGQAEVYGTAQLQGASLEIGLSSDFVPDAGDSFVLLTSDGGITGTPTLTTPNPTSLLRWDLDVDANQVIISALPALEGDYNASGSVDAADYVTWRKLVGETGPGLVADGDDNNIVNDADYEIWRTNFGSTIDAGAAGAAAVPEPATAWLVCVCAAAISRNRKRKLHYCSRPL